MCNVPIQLNGDVLAGYFSEYGDIEDITTAKSSSGTAHGDYVVTMSLDRKGFQAIPQTLDYEDQTMMVVVEGRKPQCWFCKQLGHFSRSCPQKTTIAVTSPTTTSSTTKTTTTTTSTPPSKEKPQVEARDHPDKDEEGWTQVKKKRSPKKTTEVPPTNAATAKSIKKVTKASTENANATTTTTTTEKQPSSSSSTPTKSHNTNKEKSSSPTRGNSKEEKTMEEKMETSVNLKRRRDSGDSQVEQGDKKHTKKLAQAKIQTPPALQQPEEKKG